MLFVRAAAVSLLALLAVVHTAGEASADHKLRLKVLWPRIYAPRISGHVYRDEFDDEDEEGFVDWEDEDEYIPPRRRGRNIVLDLDEDDFEPIYEPPRKAKPLKAKPKAKSANVKTVAKKPTQKTAVVVKPKAKPEIKTASIAPAPSVKTATSPVVASPVVASPVVAKAPVSSSALKAEPPRASAAVKPVTPQSVAPKIEPPKAQVATASPAAGSIGCSKGAEIVSGYGFTSVKPKTCTGTTYSFSASRATSAYLIKVAAATGEITDVQKLK
jgi:hypothetical protein